MSRSGLFLVFALSLMVLTGCTSGGGMGSTVAADDSLAIADLSASEAGLVAQRVLTAETMNLAPSLLANVVSADITGVAAFPLATVQYQGRRYQGGQQGGRRRLSRGTGACAIEWDATIGALVIGSETCQVSAVDGGYQITRANGDLITISRPTDGATESVMTINGVEWKATFSDDPAMPLLVLVNSRSGRTLTIDEDDAGNLTIAAEGIARYRGGWQADGTLDAEDIGQQMRRRYRHGA